MIVPAYGPGWRNKVPKMSLFLWNIHAIHEPIFKTIKVAPWNRRRRRKRHPAFKRGASK